MAVSRLVREIADQSAASVRVAGLSSAERAGLEALVGHLRAAGLALNGEVRALHLRAAGYGAHPDLERARQALLDLLGGVRRAARLAERLPSAVRVARGVVLSAEITPAQRARAQSAARAAGLRLSGYLRLELLARAGVAPRSAVRLSTDDADRLARLAEQLRGAAGNAARLTTDPALAPLLIATRDGGAALRRAADDVAVEARAVLTLVMGGGRRTPGER